MGRKKIEIRPLVDERNRNVTFLKRKAGLMKKAWELAVLTGADVSLLIFSNSGKPYEFSTKDLDGEIDRYLDYEGLIERRRGAEFAAMADADEDDSDDDFPRRGSTSKGNTSTPGPSRSLKGQETYKAKMTSRKELALIAKQGKEKMEKDGSFLGGILGESPSGDEASEEATPSVVEDAATENLNYALNLHSTRSQTPNQNTSQTTNRLNTMPNTAGPSNPSIPSVPHLPTQYNLPTHHTPSHPHLPQIPQQYYPSYPSQTYSQTYLYNQPAHIPSMQWNQEALTRYAEVQLQENHRRQQVQLLERQRQQLIELGIPIDDGSLIDQLFGNPSTSAQTPITNIQSQSQSQISTPQPFIWPTQQDTGTRSSIQHTRHGLHNQHVQNTPTGLDLVGGIGGDFMWPNEPPTLPSPASVNENEKKRERDGMDSMGNEKRLRVG
ncbi:hypothetical protein TREMEDRAFT_61955 [Tremella mesenterica DSM 1558]|uniref:uncharacterized protein n=1 Tax=Tremella mesenterica (strain ATCC 24925 / CBS 8224 / DSM 1558 / NBRC 9311 / NRRL Y-6157 / RJB 2259-6 / UBC 559-6) TaxID=578456 RepID=UPI0003F49A47|nr:uncharacterized protein TREMEDRAFT_61955 [Tremella mesenterica DSM 1558]EIW70194.1 hypothetical protein TREMEDRAFT_61955 [Tremella mesenterica DSM 1558]